MDSNPTHKGQKSTDLILCSTQSQDWTAAASPIFWIQYAFFWAFQISLRLVYTLSETVTMLHDLTLYLIMYYYNL